MKKGDIVLYHGTGFVDKVIQKMSHSYWNHVAVVTDVNATGPIIIEATGSGLITTQLTLGANINTLSYRDPQLTGEQIASGLAWARKKAAEKIKYNYIDIIFIGIHLLLKNWNLAVINNQYFCSEFVGKYLEHCGTDLSIDPIFLSPGNLDTIYPKLSV